MASRNESLAARNAQRFLDPVEHEKKKQKDREYWQRKQQQKKLWKHPDPLANLADMTTQERMRDEVDECDFIPSTSRQRRKEPLDTYAPPEDDILVDQGRVFTDDVGENGIILASSY